MKGSRIACLWEGNRNTHFFHRKATWRSKKNNIRRLIDEDNKYVEKKGEMEAMAVIFFEDLHKKDVSVLLESISAKLIR